MVIAPAAEVRFAVCICNDGYLAALDLHKIYRTVPDAQAEGYGLIRIVDESGEGYLYPEELFQAMDLSAAAREELLRAS
jgi:Ca2+-binding EF-hand superfamily protein